MPRHHLVQFQFDLDFNDPAHLVKSNVSPKPETDIFFKLIEANRFTLEQEHFSLLRYTFYEGYVIIQRNTIGRYNYTFCFTSFGKPSLLKSRLYGSKS